MITYIDARSFLVQRDHIKCAGIPSYRGCTLNGGLIQVPSFKT